MDTLTKTTYMKAWRKKNPLAHRHWPSTSKVATALYRLENKQNIKRIKHKHRATEKYKLWQKNYNRLPHVVLANKAKNHMRRLQAGGSSRIDKNTLQLVYEFNIYRFGKLTCYLCQQPISFGDDSIDHILPLSRGGMNEFENLGVAHKKCNFSKKSLTALEYLTQ